MGDLKTHVIFIGGFESEKFFVIFKRKKFSPSFHDALIDTEEKFPFQQKPVFLLKFTKKSGEKV